MVLFWLRLDLRRRMMFTLPFCMQSGRGFHFWRRRGISLVLGLGIMTVGWMIFFDIIILVPCWFACILLTRGSSTLWGSLVLICV